MSVVADLTRETNIKCATEEKMEKLKGLDILVNRRVPHFYLTLATWFFLCLRLFKHKKTHNISRIGRQL